MIFPKSISLLKMPILTIPSVKGLLITVWFSSVGLVSSAGPQLNSNNTDTRLLKITILKKKAASWPEEAAF